MSVTSERTVQIDSAKLDAFVNQMIGDLGAAATVPLVVIGERYGFYRQLAAHALTAQELADRTSTNERYVREWLAQQAASGYITYDSASQRFALPPEHAVLLADENSPLYIHGAYSLIESMVADEPQISKRFATGDGFGWHEHDERLFESVERFFRPSYNAHLIPSWIPSLDGVEARLKAGASVADIGCGLGSSTIILAKAYPASRFVGIDNHQASIARARDRAREAQVESRVSFEVASAKDFSGSDFDLVAIFDALHDMGDPVGAAKRIYDALAPDGTWMLVEPFAGDTLEENMNPIGRVYYAASTMICTPSSMAQEVGLALGAQAGEKRMRAIVEEAGFTRFRRAAQTPFNIVYEVRR